MATEAIDRAASLGGYGRGGGEVDPATQGRYLQIWERRFKPWCRRTGRTAMPATSETLALFAQALVQDMDYSREYARWACNAVRWKHRKDGHDPPDRRNAWYVLRYGEGMPPVFDLGPIRPACREDLLELAQVCDLTTPAGVRDLLVPLLMYAAGAGAGELAGLRLRHVNLAQGVAAQVLLPGRTVRRMLCDDWHSEPGFVQLCPTCLLARQRSILAGAGIVDEAARLLRQVDKGGNIAGSGRFAGSERDGMEKPALRKLVRRVTLAAELDDAVTRRPETALRLGGALEARDRGADRAEVAAHAGYPENSVTLARYLALPA